MTRNKKNVIIGHAITLIVFIIPFSFIFGPAVFAGYLGGLLVVFLRRNKKQDAPETKVHKQQADELMTVIQPTINSKN